MIRACMRKLIRICIHAYIPIYTYIYLYTHTYMHAYIHTYTHIHFVHLQFSSFWFVSFNRLSQSHSRTHIYVANHFNKGVIVGAGFGFRGLVCFSAEPRSLQPPKQTPITNPSRKPESTAVPAVIGTGTCKVSICRSAVKAIGGKYR